MTCIASLLLSLVLSSVSLAQLPLPSSPWLPPNATFGASPSNSSSNSTDTANPQWSTLLGDLLYFYEEQRSGKLPSTNRVPWRNDSATDDGSDVGLDLSGGYYDAGDYIKYTFPMSYTVMSVCWGALDYGKGYELANQTAYLDDMIRWSMDWLTKAHPEPNTLYVQVGNADLDNAYWGGDQSIPGNRTSFPINATHPGTDAAAQASAAFSACSALYANRTLSGSSTTALANSSYARMLLNHAQQLYSFATNSSIQQVTYQKSVPSVGQAYASSDYSDELAIAGLFLALAGNSSDAYNQAVQTYQNQKLFGRIQGGDVFNWDEKTPGVIVLGAQLMQAYPDLSAGNQMNWTSDLVVYCDGIVNGASRAYLTPGGLLYYPGDSDDASLNPALNAAMLIKRVADSNILSSDKAASYRQFAQSQIDYVLGNNPMTVPYIVGIHPNAPANPHSALSTGASPQDIANLDTVPLHEAYILYGGVVGGPDKDDRFWDLRSDWVQGEVGLDYIAPMVTLAAQSIVNGTGDPFYTTLQVGSYEERRPSGAPCDNAINSGCPGSGSWRVGKIIMAVFVSVAGAVVFALLFFWLYVEVQNR
ncbi:9 glycosyl hydrolase [Irpex rosettiformis]|uniref:9 glycosyl hydrolase n=1 Tax=Irpex rosettiformis TaxID=378272 RepID=A0ACB8UCB4_9APHY|nr:9 glycosyl hydrolase [Irpex rosettiformis]